MFENCIQAKNRNVEGVQAPEFDEYPERIDTDWLPLCLTWMTDNVPNPSDSMSVATYEVTVYVNPIGQNTWIDNKRLCREYFLDFFKEYSFEEYDDRWISNDPPVGIIPSTIRYGGYRDTVKAPDGEEFHGFSLVST